MNQLLLRSEISKENDIVWARKKSRDLASHLGFSKIEQTQLATAVSEITRNVYQYARSGMICYGIDKSFNKVWLVIEIKDSGKGIKNLPEILSGNYVSPEGMGVGIIGSKKLVDDFDIVSSPEGTIVTLKKIIPKRTEILGLSEVRQFTSFLLSASTQDPIEEIQRQHEEIALTLKELNENKERLLNLNQELEDTNRGVVALYAELDEKAESLRIASESKTSFLSDMTHEFRSPLNSILSISQLLIEDAKESKNPELERQVHFIIKAAQGLSTLVNDLLDIAKIEAGKVTVRVDEFTINDIFSALRGLMKPINIATENVELIFDETQFISIRSDEGKITQILRNLISNALKYTSAGSVRVMAQDKVDTLEISIKDTGIGIPESELDHIFSEFVQIDGPLQKRVKGTGLGLPLTRKLVTLLGGEIRVESQVGIGSTFTFSIPKTYSGPSEAQYHNAAASPLLNAKEQSAQEARILILEDDEPSAKLLCKTLTANGITCEVANNGQIGLVKLKEFRPNFLVLDLNMPILDGFGFLKEKLQYPEYNDLPIVIYTSQELDDETKAYLSQFSRKILLKNKDLPILLNEIFNYFRK